MESIDALVVAAFAFVGSHFLLSHPLRAGMVRAIGERGAMSPGVTGGLIWVKHYENNADAGGRFRVVFCQFLTGAIAGLLQSGVRRDIAQ